MLQFKSIKAHYALVACTQCTVAVDELTRARAFISRPLVATATQRPRPSCGVAADVSYVTMATKPPACCQRRIGATDS